MVHSEEEGESAGELEVVEIDVHVEIAQETQRLRAPAPHGLGETEPRTWGILPCSSGTRGRGTPGLPGYGLTFPLQEEPPGDSVDQQHCRNDHYVLVFGAADGDSVSSSSIGTSLCTGCMNSNMERWPGGGRSFRGRGFTRRP